MTTARRALAGIMAVTALVGCTSATDLPPAAGRTTAPVTGQDTADLSPRPADPVELPPLPARPARCLPPDEGRHDLRAHDAPTQWRMIRVDRDKGDMDLLAAAADGTLWTTYRHGNEVLLRRWNGREWRSFELPASPGRGAVGPVALAASSVRLAWAIGQIMPGPGVIGVVSTYEGGHWRTQPLAEPAGGVIGGGGTAARSVGPDGAWTVNERTALRWTGHEWRSYLLPANAGELGSEGEQVWAVSGGYDPPAAMRWEQGGWRLIGVPALEAPVDFMAPREILTDVVVLGRDDVWVVGGVSGRMAHEYDRDGEPLVKGHPFALHWNGASWTCHWAPLGSSEDGSSEPNSFGQAEPDGGGGLWVQSRGGVLWHLSGGTWTRHRVPAPAGYRALVASLARRPGTGEVYAVGSVRSTGHGGEVTHAALWRARTTR
ncbi:hypothetical protein [Nonomuraea jiangxiensis]|uniref:Uncharacterized protein n=1 Tax=Nonomuraea jiangxiensis TaxID=633440 RepID=A0A1G9JKF0_9ACTN|nr:hypothetical protein [Nonomuraea jiangxiensis]SDL37735.1 hypothetical protein SAMN05421869_12566 [Nonomuraea jiangxiensis]